MISQEVKKGICRLGKMFTDDFIDWFEAEWDDVVNRLKSSGKDLDIPIVPEVKGDKGDEGRV